MKKFIDLKFLPIAIPGFLLLSSLSGINNFARGDQELATKPATDMDIFLYRGMGASYLCNAVNAGVEFPKAVGIAAATYVQVLEGKHGGIVSQAGEEKLDRKKLFAGAEFQIVTAAMEFCSEQVPDDVKKKVEKVITNSKKIKGKKR